MKSTVSRAPGGRVVLDVEVSPEEMAPDIEQTFRRLARQLQVPGFRPGRAPAALVERTLGRERVLREALDGMVNRAYRSALDEQKLVPLDQPEVDVKSFEDGEPLRFEASVSVRPDVVLGDYRAIRVPREAATVQPQDVDGALEELRRARGTWVPVEEGPAAEGHLVILDTVGELEGGQPIEERRVEGVVGEGRLRPEIDAAVRGLAAGGTASVELKFGDADPNTLLAGKTARVHVSVQEVKRRELPPLDDAFAREVSRGNTLEELRQEVGSRLQRAAERQAAQAVVDKAVAAAVDGAEVEVPEVLIGRGVDNLVAESERQITAAGGTLAGQLTAQGKTMEEFRAELRPAAERRVKTELVVDAIAEDAGIVPTVKDMEDEIRRLARGSRTSPANFRRAAMLPENWGVIRFDLIQRRVARLLGELSAGVAPEEASAAAVASSREAEADAEAPDEAGAGSPAASGNPQGQTAAEGGPADGEGEQA